MGIVDSDECISFSFLFYYLNYQGLRTGLWKILCVWLWLRIRRMEERTLVNLLSTMQPTIPPFIPFIPLLLFFYLQDTIYSIILNCCGFLAIVSPFFWSDSICSIFEIYNGTERVSSANFKWNFHVFWDSSLNKHKK